MKYLMVLENKYDINLSDNKEWAISDLEQMLDNMINLCKSYGIDDEEILDNITDDTLFASIEEGE